MKRSGQEEFPSLLEHNEPHKQFVGTALLPSLTRRATLSEQKRTSLRIGSRMNSDSQQSPPRSAESAALCAFEIPNENENDGQYVSEFWLNALVPKPHTNFFGYESSIGPICISISTRESHECYKALVRTPFKFGVVYVPTMVIDEPIFGTDLDRLSSPTPQKILLYHAMRLYFQQADDERCGYLLTALRNQRLSEENAARVVSTTDKTQRQKRGLQRSGTKRSIELRRAEISEFMEGLFQSSTATAAVSASPPMSESLLDEIHEFLASERTSRDLAVATESLTEIRDDHLKPLLRNLEPRLYRRRLRIDFVVVGAQGHTQLTDATAPHRRFLRTLERVSARMRGEPNTAESPRPDVDSPQKAKTAPKTEQKPAKRKKTREELEAKRNNVVQELIATERSYVEKLRALIDFYAVPLRSAARSANNSLIPAYDAHVIFGNIERVAEVNERFLGDLEAWQQGEMDPKETIGSLCRDHFVDFHVYKRYINGYQHALTSSRELEGKNPLYAAFLQKAREREECRKLGISDLLIMPVQRIPRYTLLLTDLLKTVPDDDADVPRIQLALERVNEIGQLADNQVAESVAELHRIHTTVEGCPPNLISASREFVGAVDVSEIDLATGAPKKPVCLLVFSDLLMMVERFWPPRGHGGIRVTGRASASSPCPAHGVGEPAPGTCTCSSNSPAATAFLSTTAGGPSARKKWGRFSGWVDIARVSVLEKTLSQSSRAFYVHRVPAGDETAQPSATDSSSTRRKRTVTSGSSIVSLDSATSSPAAVVSPEQLHREFANILYPSEATYESYGDPGYWYPQSLHEFEVDHAQTRDVLFEFLNTAWERTVARCFEPESGSLSRHGSSAGALGHRKTRSGAGSEATAAATAVVVGHPELDRVDVGGQSWTVRIWDAADYIKSRASCPSALHADMTVVWDYQHAGSPSGGTACDMASYPLQACRVIGFDDDYFHVTSTMLPLDAAPAALDSYAELVEEREIADSWPALCRMVEQAITMYQYVLLAYPEHRRVQQCYNRSILASLFGQNALGSSSAVKAEAVSAAPRKLFSRAKHLFSSGKSRASPEARDSGDASNLFSSAYANAVPAETVGPAGTPYSHSTISTPLTVLGRYKLKTKSSTMASTRRANTSKDSPQSTPSRAPARAATLDLVAAHPPSNKRKGSDMSARDLTVRTTTRRPAHTIDEIPQFSSEFGAEAADGRTRSRTSAGSSPTSPTSHIQRARAVPSADFLGRSASFGKRRSMSVVSAASLGTLPSGLKARTLTASASSSLVSNSAVSSSAVSNPVAQVRSTVHDDTASEFSLQLDLPGHSDGLDIPSDLKLEFDAALNGAGSTPPHSTHTLQQSLADTLASTTDGGSSRGTGLNLLIPAGDRLLDAKTTWEARSPDNVQVPLSSAESLSSLSRRRGVYGTPPVATAMSKPDSILMDIARELSEDEHFSQPLTSPFFADDDDMARHLDQMSMLSQFDTRQTTRPQTSASHQQLPRAFVWPPPASYSAQQATGSIPQPPSSTYNLQQAEFSSQTAEFGSQHASSPSDYRRLPSLPPRVRSTAASSFIDRNSVHTNASSPSSPFSGRPRPAHPPF
ncbi:hypothetical protein GGH12_005194 [Coemansia sp. RSA 1822]|nr:hypothetical protein LPJ76_005077 [Coemansia sp. RSA 638]KAJ2119501.1 hypothetical protein IW147_005815 [Coemansia sp. RSA 720]KAJ2539860.1 hypothetical protein GGF49_004914 [Coemansia sp. RSA 1853]KAJ2559902.1 hypothetical protein GGH12_005194 [Coemansia sp. RSA 1822]